MTTTESDGMSKGNPKRSYRVDDQLWNAARAKAARLGIDLATIQRDMLRAWVNEPDNSDKQGEK